MRIHLDSQHVKRVEARQIGCEREGTVEHHHNAHKSHQQTGRKEHIDALGRSADDVQHRQPSESPKEYLLRSASLQVGNHERNEQTHADEHQIVTHLHALRVYRQPALHLAEVA